MSGARLAAASVGALAILVVAWTGVWLYALWSVQTTIAAWTDWEEASWEVAPMWRRVADDVFRASPASPARPIERRFPTGVTDLPPAAPRTPRLTTFRG